MITTREITEQIYRDPRLSGEQRELLRKLLEQREKNGEVEPRAMELMAYFDISQTAVYNRIRMCVKNGYLREVEVFGRQRVYSFALPDLPTDVARTREIAMATEDKVTVLSAQVAELVERMSGLEALLKGHARAG